MRLFLSAVLILAACGGSPTSPTVAPPVAASLNYIEPNDAATAFDARGIAHNLSTSALARVVLTLSVFHGDTALAVAVDTLGAVAPGAVVDLRVAFACRVVHGMTLDLVRVEADGRAWKRAGPAGAWTIVP